MSEPFPCPHCRSTDGYRHLHNAAHGIPGTHMAGSERFECASCGCSLTKAEAIAAGKVFRFDVEVPVDG